MRVGGRRSVGIEEGHMRAGATTSQRGESAETPPPPNWVQKHAGTPNPWSATQCVSRRTSSRRRQDKSKQCKAARDRRKPEQEADTSQETDLAGAHGAERFAGGREERHSHGLRLRHHRLQPLYLLVRHQRAGKQKPAESGPGGRQGGRDQRRAQDKWVEIRRGRAKRYP